MVELSEDQKRALEKVRTRSLVKVEFMPWVDEHGMTGYVCDLIHPYVEFTGDACTLLLEELQKW